MITYVEELDPVAGDHDETLSWRCVVGTTINKSHHLSEHPSGSLAVDSSSLTLVAGGSFGIHAVASTEPRQASYSRVSTASHWDK